MKRFELRKANDALHSYERAKADREAIQKQIVVGIMLAQALSDRDPIALRHGQGGGNGTITSIGYPESLRLAMSAALKLWADERLAAAEAALKSYGIEIDE